MLLDEVLILELGAIDGLSASAVTSGEITTLQTKIQKKEQLRLCIEMFSSVLTVFQERKS